MRASPPTPGLFPNTEQGWVGFTRWSRTNVLNMGVVQPFLGHNLSEINGRWKRTVLQNDKIIINVWGLYRLARIFRCKENLKTMIPPDSETVAFGGFERDGFAGVVLRGYTFSIVFHKANVEAFFQHLWPVWMAKNDWRGWFRPMAK